MEEQESRPGPTSYNAAAGFELATEYYDVGTAAFKQPLQKKVVAVNMYNPHEDASKKTKSEPGPGSYNIGKQLPKVGEVDGDDEIIMENRGTGGAGKIYVENNTDRFGKPILPRKPILNVPGPGAYDA